MKIPEKIKIGGHIYKVIFKDDMDDENMGVCRPSKLKIFVDKNLPQSKQEETFIHEVLHAIFHQLGSFTVREQDEEEKMAQSVGHSLYQFLSENKFLK